MVFNKKFFVLLLFLAVCLSGLFACDNKAVKNSTDIYSETLDIDLENHKVYGVFPNNTTTFKFNENITVANGANYYLCNDELGENAILSKTATLTTGDNLYYIIVENGDNIVTYTVILRVKPLYTVSFNTNGGSDINNQLVEEGGLIEQPKAPIKLGCIFCDWEYDFTKPIVSDMTINARWESNSEMKSFNFVSNGEECLITGVKSTLIEEVIIPNYVTEVGDEAFYNCNKLSSIIIPDSVAKIGMRAFYSCDDLIDITIGNGVIDIGLEAFANCTMVKSVLIGSNVRNIGKGAFAWCVNLKSIVIPDSVQKIDSSAFYLCRSLNEIKLGNLVSSIGMSAFECCNSLTSITLPSSLQSIGNSAFNECHKLIEVINLSNLWVQRGGNTNGKVGYYALNIKSDNKSDIINYDDFLFYRFLGKNYLLGYIGDKTEIELPISYDILGQYEIYQHAFTENNCLNKITIYNNVTKINECAFSWCINLKEVVISNQVTNIGRAAFSSCTSLDVISYLGTKVEWQEIVKETYWNNYCAATVVHCTDGDINI